MASDGKILDELHFLSWKIEAVDRKLETSLAIQEDLAASLLEDSSSVASTMAIKKFDRRHISGPSCSEPISSEDEQNSLHYDGTSSKDLAHEQERSTSYLIIPVGSYKDKDSHSFPMEKQTFTWSEIDDNACKYISSDGALIGDKEIENNLDANERDSNKLNISKTLSRESFEKQTTPLNQSRFVASEQQMCTQWNGNDSEIMPLEDCSLNSRRSHSIACEPFEGQRKVGGAFDIEYDQDEKMVSPGTKTTLSSDSKYGLTIGIATGKGSSPGIVLNDINSLRKADKRGDQYPEHSQRYQTHFEADELEQQRAVAQQLGLLLYESTTQSTHYSDEVTFDEVCNHPSNSMYCDSGLTDYKQSSSNFSSDIKAYYTEKDNQPAYNVIYVDSEPFEPDQTNYDFVDAYVQDTFPNERNPSSLNANLSVNSSLANSAPDRQQVSADYPLLVKNGRYETDVYLTQKTQLYQKGNHRFKQNEIDCDTASEQLIEMQMNRASEEQRYEDSHKRSYAEKVFVHNGQDDDKVRRTRVHDMVGNVNNNGESSKTAVYRVNRTKPPFQEVDDHISQFGDRVYGIVGYNSDYKAINTNSSDTIGVRKAQSINAPVNFSYEKIAQNPDDPPRGPHTHAREDPLYNDTQSKFHFDADPLTESGFSETLMSALSDDVFFAATPNPDSEYRNLSSNAYLVNHSAKFAATESESPHSSLTSVSSNNNEVIYPWKLRNDSLSRRTEDGDRKQYVIPSNGDSPQDGSHQRSTAHSYVRDNDSSSDSEAPVRSFRLSPLPRPAHPPSLHEQLMSHDVIPRDYASELMRVSSPTSSVDTSDLSMCDSICECQYQCECQTGIPSAEDFREELKAISTYVLNARKESASSYKKPRTRYFLDEEQGEMDIFDGRLQKKENKVVPVFVRVILRLRKHFFGTLESKTPYNAKTHGDVNNNESDSSNQSELQTSSGKQRIRKISFSPSAMLLSAIGENSAAEVKEVIEKEKIDVNQLSPSGRSLLHKSAAAGDLESIHTLIQYGAVVNIPDQDGFPPIHSALRKAHFKCAILLIECGTDVARYTTERVREFLEIKDMTSGHLPVLLKTNL